MDQELDQELDPELDAFCSICRAYLSTEPHDAQCPRARGAELAGVRCRDCGAHGERTGHMECPYPEDHE